jgi:hypothetical protein
MPVVINDFEVVAEPSPDSEQEGSKPAGEKPKPAEAPEDADWMLRFLSGRHERLRAH